MPYRPDPIIARYEPIARLRKKPLIGVGLTIVAVAIAALARILLHGVLEGIAPFLTFYPAIIFATLIGGLRCGVLAIGLSVATADYVSIPPFFQFSLTWSNAIAVGLFALVSLIQIALVTLLNTIIGKFRDQAENLRFVLETEPSELIAVDQTGAITLVNTAIERCFGYQRNELIGQTIDALVPEGSRAGHAKLRTDYFSNPTSRLMGAGRDLNGTRRDGTEVPVEIGLNPFFRDGRSGAIVTVIDISERKEAQRRQEILMHEVQHRTRNVLGIIQAIAVGTIKGAERAAFLDRLTALGRTQDVFSKVGTTSLHKLIEAELSPLGGRCLVEGNELVLTPRAAQDLTLIVHELTTNAVKYGALSNELGHVEVRWSADDKELVFNWTECNGPVVSPPQRRGFGQTVITGLSKQFATHVVVDYRPDGLFYELRADLAKVAVVVSLARAD